jgi:hypothetical protein
MLSIDCRCEETIYSLYNVLLEKALCSSISVISVGEAGFTILVRFAFPFEDMRL